MAAPPRFVAFAEAALFALAREAPTAYVRLAVLAGAEGVRVDVEGPPVVVRFGARSHSIESAPAPAAVAVRSDRATIVALLDGDLTLRDAIGSDRLQLEGDVDALLRFEQALGAFLDGAARSRSFPALLAAFRAAD